MTALQSAREADAATDRIYSQREWRALLRGLLAEIAGMKADAEIARSRYIVGWLDGHKFIGLPEDAKINSNAKPVFQFNID